MTSSSPNWPEPPTGCFDGPVHRFAVRAYFEDTDLSGVVYHANYLRWFERARSDMLRLLGVDQRAAFEAGEGAYAVTELSIRYLVVTIESETEELRAASCRIHQRALRGQTLLSDARLRVGFVGPDGRPRRQPAPWRAAFATITISNPPFGEGSA
jgi:acyl-CoA thioester hydrolase